jgi:biopolymer transport protein ExbD
MAFSMNNGGLGGGRGRNRGGGSLAEINIVPLVDVVMVLLVIFMLTAHVMEFGMEVDVPKVKTTKDSAQELPVITVAKNGMLYLNDEAVNINDMGSRTRQKFGRAKSVYVRADKEVTWDVLAQVVAELNDQKLSINMVTQPTDEADKKRP